MWTDETGDLRKALNVAGIAVECTEMAQLQDHLLPGLVRLIGADLAIYHEASIGALHGAYRQVDVVWPDPHAVATAMAEFSTVATVMPVLDHLERHPGTVAIMLHELVSRRAWHANPAYHVSLRHLSIEDQLAHVLYVEDGIAHGLTLSRSAPTFGAREAMLVHLLAPHISAAIRRCRAAGVPYRAVVITPRAQISWVRPLALASADPLTRREREILGWVGQGFASKQIARIVGIKARTVDKHLENAYRRLGVSNRIDAALAVGTITSAGATAIERGTRGHERGTRHQDRAPD